MQVDRSILDFGCKINNPKDKKRKKERKCVCIRSLVFAKLSEILARLATGEKRVDEKEFRGAG